MKTLRAVIALVLAGVSATVAALTAAPAYASCMGTPPPAKTVFTGTVTSTSHGGRQAMVRTTDGRTVTVNGTPDLDAAATSVDRTFQEGATYEFHVLNETSPYEDNACTATKQIAAGPGGKGSRPPMAAIAISGATVFAAAAVVIVLMRRRAGGRTPPQTA